MIIRLCNGFFFQVSEALNSDDPCPMSRLIDYWPDEEPGVSRNPGGGEEESEAETEAEPGAGGRGERGRGRETVRAKLVTNNIWTSRKMQAPARAQYSQPVWKLTFLETLSDPDFLTFAEAN